MCAEPRRNHAVRSGSGGAQRERPQHRPVVTVGKEHPYHWLWEPLEEDPGFILSPMFGGKAVYLDGRLTLFFIRKDEPWRGVLVCTDRCHHTALRDEFPVLAPHEVLPKWLCLPEITDRFETSARQLVELVRQRDPRIGVQAKAKKKLASPPEAREK